MLSNILLNQQFKKLLDSLSKGDIKEEMFFAHLDSIYHDSALLYEILISAGLPLMWQDSHISLKTQKLPWQEQIFCIVDIETNGSNPDKNQIIEIGAVKWQNGKILDSFESLVYCEELNEEIEKLTSLNVDMLKNADKIKPVLEKFKLFLQDCVFVAHSVEFDYKFISTTLEKNDLEVLMNRKICTIKFAKKTIPSEKYGLTHLNTFLGINNTSLHRAYIDAKTALSVFEMSLALMPKNIYSTEDLIKFCN